MKELETELWGLVLREWHSNSCIIREFLGIRHLDDWFNLGLHMVSLESAHVQ
jgi:hypothetical protein